ncbi:DUF6255 family natural product biosynthesis protein [Streptomyces sp. C36]|uniref:DUF6255 family natural product biosynthesis protein n=1 Tax=Streptomyces sp. C36 TaxID=3237122 RepID=UPI0034C65E5D
MTLLQAALGALFPFVVLHLFGCALSTRPTLSAPAHLYTPPRAARFALSSSGAPQGCTPLARSEVPAPGRKAALACTHPDADWTTSGGMQTCTRCGTRRVVDYRALALALELPERGPSGHPDGPTVAGSGTGAMRRIGEAHATNP